LRRLSPPRFFFFLPARRAVRIASRSAVSAAFSLRVLGQPSRLGLFPGLTFRFASRGFGSLPGGQLGRLALFRCSSGRLALRNPTVTIRDRLLTSL